MDKDGLRMCSSYGHHSNESDKDSLCLYAQFIIWLKKLDISTDNVLRGFFRIDISSKK